MEHGDRMAWGLPSAPCWSAVWGGDLGKLLGKNNTNKICKTWDFKAVVTIAML